MGKVFILLRIHLTQEEGCREDVGVGGQQTRQRQDKLPTSKIYTTWAHILSDCYVICTPRGGGKMVGSNAPGAFLVTLPSGRGLVIPVFFFYPAIRMGSNNTA